MRNVALTPFESIESAQDFVAVLAETVIEAKQEIQNDLAREANSATPRRKDALQIALYNLEKLESHMTRSRRILNDLRSLRRLLFEERKLVSAILTRPGSPAIPAAIRRAVLSEVQPAPAVQPVSHAVDRRGTTAAA